MPELIIVRLKECSNYQNKKQTWKETENRENKELFIDKRKNVKTKLKEMVNYPMEISLPSGLRERKWKREAIGEVHSIQLLLEIMCCEICNGFEDLTTRQKRRQKNTFLRGFSVKKQQNNDWWEKSTIIQEKCNYWLT